MAKLPNESPFTRRLRITLVACLRLKPPYNASDFRLALDACQGDFVPQAKKMLREHLHDGVLTLARRKALELSMESIIANEPEWRELFTNDDRKLALDRIETARRMVEKP